MFQLVTEANIRAAAEIHAKSWKESHKSFCSSALFFLALYVLTARSSEHNKIKAVFREKQKRNSTANAVLFLARKEGFEASFFVAALRFPAFLCRNCVQLGHISPTAD